MTQTTHHLHSCVACGAVKRLARKRHCADCWTAAVSDNHNYGRPLPRARAHKHISYLDLSVGAGLDSDGDCWIWQGPVTSHGYGSEMTANVREYAHRLSYETFIGQIPTGMNIDHTCRNRLCVNPDHLEAVTPAENIRRALPYRAHPRRRSVTCTHDDSDVYVWTNPKTGHTSRICRPCRRERVRLWRADKRGQYAHSRMTP